MQKIVKLFLVSLLLLVNYAALSQTTSQPSNTALEPAGQMVWVDGEVKAAYPHQLARVLTSGSIVYEKDQITTGPNGSGQVAFTDNSMVTLNPNSVFVIEQYYFNQAKPALGQSIMNLITGGFRTITGFIAKAHPANYEMKTPVAVIGVRGTDYQGMCSSSGECVFNLISGVITLTNATGSYTLNPEVPTATVSSYTTKAILSKSSSAILGKQPVILPAKAPPPRKNGGGGANSGNCGILIN